MTTSRPLRSDLPVPPGDYLLEVLQERGMTQTELARRLGRPLQPINEIAHGKKAITVQTALQLEHVLGVPAHIWTSLEAEYRIALARKSAHLPRGAARHALGRPARRPASALASRRH